MIKRYFIVNCKKNVENTYLGEENIKYL